MLGAILMFDRRLRVGDSVQLEPGVHGEARDINIRATRSALRVGPRLHDLRKRLCQQFQLKEWPDAARVATVRYAQRRIASFSIRAAQLLHRRAPRTPAGALSVHDL